jgi:hypothetical protein
LICADSAACLSAVWLSLFSVCILIRLLRSCSEARASSNPPKAALLLGYSSSCHGSSFQFCIAAYGGDLFDTSAKMRFLQCFRGWHPKMSDWHSISGLFPWYGACNVIKTHHVLVSVAIYALKSPNKCIDTQCQSLPSLTQSVPYRWPALYQPDLNLHAVST